jgi:steroid delta-isomerase-like uncharacterized protein
MASEPQSSTLSPADVVRSLIAALNARHLDAALALVAEDSFNHVALPGTHPGRDGWTVIWRMLFSAYPDFTITIEQTVEQGDTVATRYTHRGTQTGEFMGQPPSGKSFVALGLDMIKVRDGLIVEHWGLSQPWG